MLLSYIYYYYYTIILLYIILLYITIIISYTILYSPLLLLFFLLPQLLFLFPIPPSSSLPHPINTCRYLHILIYIPLLFSSSLLFPFSPLPPSSVPSQSHSSLLLFLSFILPNHLFSSHLPIFLFPLPIFILYLSVLGYGYLYYSNTPPNLTPHKLSEGWLRCDVGNGIWFMF